MLSAVATNGAMAAAALGVLVGGTGVAVTGTTVGVAVALFVAATAETVDVTRGGIVVATLVVDAGGDSAGGSPFPSSAGVAQPSARTADVSRTRASMPPARHGVAVVAFFPIPGRILRPSQRTYNGRTDASGLR
ncbi:MAG: hypothetical protein AB7I38_03920 [Dehalococcoidia bacterium]